MSLDLDTLGLSATVTAEGISAPDYQTVLDTITGYFQQIYGKLFEVLFKELPPFLNVFGCILRSCGGAITDGRFFDALQDFLLAALAHVVPVLRGCV